jgi:hypothetical protein
MPASQPCAVTGRTRDAAGAIPVIGSALPIGNRIRKLVKAADKLDDVVDTANDVRKVENAADTAKVLTKKEAVKEAHQQVGKQAKGEPGKFGSPTRGDSRKGYRLDPPNPRGKGLEKTHRHINWWDYTKGKRSSGKGRKGYIPIED